LAFRRVAATHQALREEAARRGPRAMIASTLVVLLARDGHFACLWAGDSRIYLLRAGQMVQVTRDHSLVQELVDAGTIKPEEAEGHPRANVITRAVGADCDPLELDKISDRLIAGDRFLLCSDGLNKAMSDAERGSPSDLLLNAALQRHATDNVTAVTMQAAP